MRSWRARLLALVAAATLLMPASALAQVVYLCKMTGAIGERCCCSSAKDAAPQAAPSHPAVERPDCCELQLQASRDAVASAAQTMPSVGPAVLVSTLTIEELVDRGGTDELSGAPQARGPPSIGPPLYLENCSLLR